MERLDAPPFPRGPSLAEIESEVEGTWLPYPSDAHLLQWIGDVKLYPVAVQIAMGLQATQGDLTVAAAIEDRDAYWELRLREAQIDNWTLWQKVLIVGASIVGGCLLGLATGYVAAQ